MDTVVEVVMTPVLWVTLAVGGMSATATILGAWLMRPGRSRPERSDRDARLEAQEEVDD